MAIPITPQVTQFLAKLLRASREGRIEWEASPIDDHKLIAPLEDGYHIELQEVSDFDGESDTSDHVLTLEKDTAVLFSVTRLVIDSKELSAAVGETIDYSYRYFVELWGLAVHKARKIGDHLSVVNRFLDSKISRN